MSAVTADAIIPIAQVEAQRRMRVVAFIARLISHQIQKHELQRCEGRQRPALDAGNWRREKNYSIISAISRSIASRCAT